MGGGRRAFPHSFLSHPQTGMRTIITNAYDDSCVYEPRIPTNEPEILQTNPRYELPHPHQKKASGAELCPRFLLSAGNSGHGWAPEDQPETPRIPQ